MFETMHSGRALRVTALAFGAIAACLELVGCNLDAGASGASPVPTAALRAQASSAALPHISNTSLPLPATISLDVAGYESSNHPGPWIEFSGLTMLGGFGVELIFSNNLKGTHEYTVDGVVDAVVQESGETITIPKQPVDGGAGGNPFVWIQLLGADGEPVSEEMFVGRIVQGFGWHAEVPLRLTTEGWAEFTVTGCSNSPGPYISFTSGMSLGGLTARIIFRNNDNKVGGPHRADVTTDVTLIAPGMTYEFPKQPVEGGVGGNPWILAGFTDGASVPLSEATLIGRCVQLDQSLN